MAKNVKKDHIRIWTEKIFYYVELIHSVSGFLVDARLQLSKRDTQKPVIPIDRSDEPNGSNSNDDKDKRVQPANG